MDRPVFRLDESTYATDSLIPIAGESIGYRCEFIKAIRSRRTPMFCSAAESIDAAVVLLAVDQVSQAYLLLMQAVEVTLKGWLDEVMQLGLSSWMAQNPADARNLASQSPSLVQQRLQGPLRDKTSTDAFQLFDLFLGLSPKSKNTFDIARGTRNNIAHRGGDAAQTHNYVRDIVGGLFPLLDEVYEKATNLHLADFLFHDVAREIVVAARFLKGRPNDPRCWGIATAPLSAAYFHRRHIAPGPSPFDAEGEFKGPDWWVEDEWQERVAKELQFRNVSSDLLGNDYFTSCRICDEFCHLATDGELHAESGEQFFAVTSMACPNCHLTIPEEYSDLAAIHYGRINEQLLGADDWHKLIKDYGYTDQPEQEAHE